MLEKMTNQKKGILYEEYVCKRLKESYDQIFLWKDCPESILIEHKIILNYDIYSNYRKDIGIDIVAIKDNKPVFIQCKNHIQNVTINDISGFLWFIGFYAGNNESILCYSNGISKNILDTISERNGLFGNSKLSTLHIPFVNPEIIPDKENINEKIIPKDYQLEAVNKLKSLNKSILSLPCGMGKTFTASLIAKKYSNIIVIAPLRQLVLDLADNFSNYINKDHKKVIISSDGFTNYTKLIKQFGMRNIVSVTYDSVNVLNQVIDILFDSIIIIDEYHNLSKNNLENHEDPIYKLINSNKKILYLSATPNLNIKYDGIYKYEWSEAIKNKYICDFNITIPSKSIIEKEKINNMVELLKDINDVNEIMIKKAYFIVKSMMFNGNRKCIIYQTSIEKSLIFGKIVEGIFKILNIDHNIEYINSNTTKKKRIEILNTFKNSKVISILMNVQILNEGINIPECDSVFITQPNNNIVNIVQRLCRCNRITKNKDKCNMYIWSTKKKIKILTEYVENNTGNVIKFATSFDPKSYTNITIGFGDDNAKTETSYNLLEKYELFHEIFKPYEFIDEYFIKNIYGKIISQDTLSFDIKDVDVSNCLGIKLSTLRERLSNRFGKNKNYVEKVDFIKMKHQKTSSVTYMLNCQCFGKLAFSSDTKNSKAVRTYFIKLREFLADKYKFSLYQNDQKFAT